MLRKVIDFVGHNSVKILIAMMGIGWVIYAEFWKKVVPEFYMEHFSLFLVQYLGCAIIAIGMALKAQAEVEDGNQSKNN